MYKIILYIFSILLTLSSVAAFGVTSPYWEGNPLVLLPGNSKEVTLELQNMVGGDDLILEATLVSGSEVARFTDKSLSYTVLYGQEGIPVHLAITIPQNAKAGTTYKVHIAFKTLLKKGDTPVQLSTQIEKAFDVIVGSEEPITASATKNLTQQTPTIAFILLIVIICWVFFWKKHRKRVNP